MPDNLRKLYRLESVGGPQLIKELNDINRLFREIRKTKIALNTGAAPVEDPAKLAEISRKLEELRLKEKELSVALKEKQIELRTEQILQKQLAAARQQELNEQRLIRAGNQALSGSYNDVAKRYRDLLNISKNTTSLGNPREVAEAAAELKRLKDQLDAFNRSLSRDGTLVGEYTTGIVQAFRRLGAGGLIEDKLNRDKAALRDLDTQFASMTTRLRALRTAGDTNLGALEADMVANRTEAGRLSAGIRDINTSLRSTGGLGAQVGGALREEFRNAGRQLSQFLVGYLGFQAVLRGGRQAISINRELGDSFVDLKRILQTTDDEVEKIVADLKNIDTRTGITELEKFAIIAAKAGVATKDIAGVTKAIDDLQLVAGKELGNVEESVVSLIKLVNVFEGPGKATADNIYRYGNALVDLANKGVASGGYLVDFASRLAGIEGISKIQIQSVLGLASAFDEQGQSAEVASTAVTQVILKMGQDVPKFAAIAKMTEEAFKSLLRSNPAEALIRVSEASKGGGASIDEISKNFAELEVRGVRVAGVLGVLADKGDFFRQKIDIASAGIKDNSAILEGAADKQKTFGGTVDRVGAALQKAASNRAFVTLLQVLASVVLLVVGNLGIVIGALALYGTALAIANAAQIRLWVATKASNIVSTAEAAILVLKNLYMNAYTATVLRLTAAQSGAAASATILRVALSALGIGAVIALVAVLIGTFDTVSASINGTTDALRGHAKELAINNQITKLASDAIAEETTKLRINVEIIKDLSNSNKTRRQTLDALIAAYPAFSKVLDGERILVDKIAKAYEEVANNINLAARAKAAAGLAAEKGKGVGAAQTLLSRIETEAAIQNPGKNGDKYIIIEGLSEEDKKAFVGGAFGNALTRSTSASSQSNSSAGFYAKDLGKVRAFLNGIVADKTRIYSEYTKASAGAESQLADSEAKSAEATAANIDAKAKAGTVTIGELEARINDLRERSKRLGIGTKELQENIALTKQLEKQLADASGKETKSTGGTRGSRIDGADKDRLALVDAGRDTSIAEEQLRVEKLRALRELTEAEEIEHENRLFSIRDNASKRKLALLDGSNAAEKKKEGEVLLEQLQQAKESNEKIYKIRAEGLERNRTANTNKLKDTFEGATEGVNVTPAQKAEATAEYYGGILLLQQQFNSDMDRLEKDLSRQSKANQEARARTLQESQRDANASLAASTKAGMEQAIAENNELSSAIAVSDLEALGRRIQAVVDRAGGSAEKKTKEIKKLQQEAARGALENEVKRIDTELALLDRRLLGEQEYTRRYLELVRQRAEANGQIQSLQLEKQQEADRKRNLALEAGFSLAGKGEQAYFESQNRKIDLNYQEAQSVQDKEKEKRLALASSAEEREAIEAEYESRRRELERQRNEERKESVRKQMYVEYALASIKAFSTATDPASALATFAVLSGELAISLALLNSQNFAHGGSLNRTLSAGGRFAGPSHAAGGIRFLFGGVPTEVEGEEGFVINKRSMASGRRMTVTGTPAEIASAANTAGGGVAFAPGARVVYRAYGGGIGASLRAPSYVSSSALIQSTGSTNNSAEFDRIYSLLAANQNAIDEGLTRIAGQRLVVPVPQVTSIQQDIKNASAIGTL